MIIAWRDVTPWLYSTTALFIPTGVPDTNYLPCQLIHFDNQIILYNIEGISETK